MMIKWTKELARGRSTEKRLIIPTAYKLEQAWRGSGLVPKLNCQHLHCGTAYTVHVSFIVAFTRTGPP